jgi:hypothetical protein
MATSTKRKRLLDAYRFPGFRPVAELRGVFGDPYARVISLVRRSKKLPVVSVVGSIRAGTTAQRDRYAICPAGAIASTSSWRYGVSCAAGVAG